MEGCAGKRNSHIGCGGCGRAADDGGDRAGAEGVEHRVRGLAAGWMAGRAICRKRGGTAADTKRTQYSGDGYVVLAGRTDSARRKCFCRSQLGMVCGLRFVGRGDGCCCAAKEKAPQEREEGQVAVPEERVLTSAHGKSNENEISDKKGLTKKQKQHYEGRIYQLSTYGDLAANSFQYLAVCAAAE